MNGKDVQIESRWNPELIQRLKDNLSNFFAIDSLFLPNSFSVGDKVDEAAVLKLAVDKSKYIAYSSLIPATPKELSGTEEIFIILTDNLDSIPITPLVDGQIPIGRDPNEMGRHRVLNTVTQICTFLLMAQLAINAIQEKSADGRITRRSFLKLLRPIIFIPTFLGSELITGIIRDAISRAPTKFTQDAIGAIYREINTHDLFSGVLGDGNWWIDGRTALTYSKIDASVTELRSSGRVKIQPNDRATAVFGLEHITYDDSKREQLIETYFKNLKKVLEVVIKKPLSKGEKLELYQWTIMENARWEADSLKQDQAFLTVEAQGYDQKIIDIGRKVFEIDTLIS